MSDTSKTRRGRRQLLTSLAAVPAAGLLGGIPTVHAENLSEAERRARTSMKEVERRARAALKDAKGTKLVLLGTGGGPVPGRSRHMTSNVMVHDGSAYVLDFGLGVTNQLARTGIPFDSVRTLFLTHHHPDHNIEIGPFLVTGWIHGLKQSVTAYGPPPLQQMIQDYMRSAKVTIDFWAEDFKKAPLEMIDVHELPQPGPVMQDENVKVTSVLVQHPPVTPAYGYRFDFPDRSIAFSGDTVPLESVAQMAKGADVLVHEAMDMIALDAYVRHEIAAGQHVKFKAFMHHMLVDHSPVREVGRIAQEAGVKTLVLSHLTPSLTSISDKSWREQAAKHFKGEIIVGHDLMVI